MSATSRLNGLALLATSELTISAGGAITITAFYHTVAANGGGADNLDTITNGYTTLTVNGSDYYPFVYLKGKAGDTITVRHGQDNIDLPDDTDFVLATDAWTVFIWDGTNYTTTKAAKAAISSGESNTASNQGAGGVGLYIQKTGVDLEFKNVNAASAKITVADDAVNHEVDIDLGTVDFSDLNTKTHTHQDAANGGQLDHGLALTGLADDDHTQYALLAGRSGGQNLIGGSDASDDLTLTSTSNATKGDVIVEAGNRLVLQDHATIPPLNVTERNAGPGGPAAGDIYLDDGTNTASGNPGWRRYTGAAWEDISAASGGTSVSYAILRDEKATTTDGGGCAATTWNNRDVNTEAYDPDGIVTIAANQFTPIAGDYLITVAAPCYRGGDNRLRLYNVTGTASVEEGLNVSAGTSGTTSSTAFLRASFTANGSDAYRVDHYTKSAQATNGLGRSVSDGTNETYMTIRLEKI